MNYFDQDKFKNLVRALQQMVRCPQCAGVFNEKDVELVAGIGQSYFVKMSCSRCGISVMASMMNMDSTRTNQAGAGFLGERKKVMPVAARKNIGRITTDELIGLHQYLKDFAGDFKAVFK